MKALSVRDIEAAVRLQSRYDILAYRTPALARLRRYSAFFLVEGESNAGMGVWEFSSVQREGMVYYDAAALLSGQPVRIPRWLSRLQVSQTAYDAINASGEEAAAFAGFLVDPRWAGLTPPSS